MKLDNKEMTVKSIEVYAKEYKDRFKSEDFMQPAENLIRPIKRQGLNKVMKDFNHALDFGCGDGRHTLYLSKLGYKVNSVDVDQSAIDATEKNIILNGDIDKVTFDLISNSCELLHLKQKFKLIIAWEVLHWLGHKTDWVETLATFYKILSKDGRVILTMPTENHFLLAKAQMNGDDEYLATEKSREDCLFYAPNLDSLKNIFQSIGFKIIEHSFFAHGNTKEDWSISNPFSMYVFTLSK